MKKNKLNAVVASVLSLGIVCSGSVFATRGEGKDSKRIGKKVVICTRNEMEKGAEMVRGKSRKKIEVKPKNELREEPKLRRCNATLNSSTFEKARIAPKTQKSKIHSTKKVKSETVDKLGKKTIAMGAIKVLLDRKLSIISKCSKNWVTLRSLFGMEGFKKLPLDSEEFISESLSCHDELCRILSGLDAQSIMNGLTYESEIFSDLLRICGEIYNQRGDE